MTTTAPTTMMREKKKILILLSDTGGGHRASAGAVTEGLISVFGEDTFDFVVLDIWTEYGNWPFNSFVSVYRFASENPWCWRWMYESSKSPISRSLFLASGYAVSGVNIKKVVLDVNPHMIISVHPLCQHIILQVLRELKEEAATSQGDQFCLWRMPPFVTVVTDLGNAHPTWFHPKATRVYVPSTNILQNARMEGVNAAKIKHYGLPLRKPFWTRITDTEKSYGGGPQSNQSGLISAQSYFESDFREKIEQAQTHARQKLHLNVDYPTVLVVGGGEGVGALDHVTEGIVTWALKSAADAYQEYKVKEGTILGELQILVVCGKNENTRTNVLKVLGTIAKDHPAGRVNIENRSSTYAGPGAVAGLTCINEKQTNPLIIKPAAQMKPNRLENKAPMIKAAKYVESPRNIEENDARSCVRARSPDLNTLNEAAKASDIPVEELLDHVELIRQESIKKEELRCQELEADLKHTIQAIDPFALTPSTPQPAVRVNPRELIPKLDTRQVKADVGQHVQVSAVVYGFVSNIDELMTASDLIVTKAGPGTIAEATTRALPILLSSYMPGQEEGNVSFVLNNKFGTYCEDPNQIGLIVREWLLNPRFEIKMNNMRYRSLKCANPEASIDIARDIGRLIGLA